MTFPKASVWCSPLSKMRELISCTACGGNARCTTCRVEFIAGEPSRMTVAERDVLSARGLTGIRVSCQIPCDHDMTVRALSRLAGSGRKDAGHEPAANIEPPPVWVEK